MKHLNGIEAGVMVASLLAACYGRPRPIPAVTETPVPIVFPTIPPELVREEVSYTGVFLLNGGIFEVCTVANRANGGIFVSEEEGKVVYFPHIGSIQGRLEFVNENEWIVVDDGLILFNGRVKISDEMGSAIPIYYDDNKWTDHCPKPARGVEASQLAPSGRIF